MFTSLFWKDMAERAVWTFAQAILGFLIVAPQTSIVGFDWLSILGIGATAALIAVLKALVAGKVNKKSISPASFAIDERGI